VKKQLKVTLSLILLAMPLVYAEMGEARQPNASPIAVNLSSLKFTPDEDEPCFSGATLRGDPSSGPSMEIYRVTRDCTIPMHWHSAAESLVIISGTDVVSAKGLTPVKLRPGGFFFQPARLEGMGTFTRGTLFVVSFEGPVDVHYVGKPAEESHSGHKQ
jgi:hypothetical protein